MVRSSLLVVLEYLLGFLALMMFAALAFGSGAPSDEQFVIAFKVAGSLAVVELAALLWRPAPANRLIIGANLWLAAGMIAAFTEQWWWLKMYQRLGEASLFASLMAVGLISTAFSSTGFVGAVGERGKVLKTSVALLVAVAVALGASIAWRGNVQWAAIIPVIALAWFQRLLKHVVQRTAPGGSAIP